MTSDINKQIEEQTQRRMKWRSISVHMNAKEFAERDKMANAHKGARINMEKQYRDQYTQRVAKETSRLIAKDGQKNLILKPSWGDADKFNGPKINKQAQLNVRLQHRGNMEALQKSQNKQLDGFYDRVNKRNQKRGVAKASFNGATDRRTSERRQDTPSRSRPSQSRAQFEIAAKGPSRPRRRD